MSKLVGQIVSLVHFILFFIALLIFHLPQVIAKTLFGYNAHKKVVDTLCFLILKLLGLFGTRIEYNCNIEIPDNRPLIIISNHQSMYDIAMIIWFFRKRHPKFVSKRELAKWIPSISYNLRHGGSVLINRSDRKQALSQIAKLGEYIEENKFTTSLFPEGTRARDGIMKKFKPAGLVHLIHTAPSALIVPVAVENSWKIMKDKMFPVPFGLTLKFTVLEPVEINEFPENELTSVLEARIRSIVEKKESSVLQSPEAREAV